MSTLAVFLLMLTWCRWKKRPSLRRRHLPKERKLLNINLTILKAGLMACFFFVAIHTNAKEYNWHFDPELESIYKLAINLQTDQALARLSKVNDKDREFYKIYLQSPCETIDVLIGE